LMRPLLIYNTIPDLIEETMYFYEFDTFYEQNVLLLRH
jgi:hypothetical protein